MTIEAPTPWQMHAYSAQPAAIDLAGLRSAVEARSTLKTHRPVLGERRRTKRQRFSYELYVTPLTGGVTIRAFGKDLTEEGIGIYHDGPLPFRRCYVEVRGTDSHLRFEVDLAWCRSLDSGWYESGGRILRVMEGE